MKVLTVVLFGLALALAVTAYFQGGNRHVSGAMESGRMLLSVLPTMLCAFLVAGYMRVLLPASVVQGWLGEESGFKGVLVGYAAGLATVGGPFISFPIAASLYHAGASVLTVTTYITSWALWGGGAAFYELAILGPRLFVIRIVASLILPIIAGSVAAMLARSWP